LIGVFLYFGGKEKFPVLRAVVNELKRGFGILEFFKRV